jgi:tetratricopeptide (TPR) repeat protein
LYDQSTGGERATLRKLLLRLLNLRMQFRRFLADFRAARVDGERALTLADATEDREELAWVLNNLGVIAGHQGQMVQAAAQLEESLAIFRDLNHAHGIADTEHELAQVVELVGDYTAAKQRAQESVAAGRQIRRPDLMAHALDTLGMATFCLGEYADAEQHWQASLTTFRSIDHQLGVSLALGGLALAGWAAGNLDSARPTAEAALAACRATHNRLHLCGRLLILGEVACAQGDYAVAAAAAQEGVAVATQIGSPWYAAYNLVVLSEIKTEQGELAQARDYAVQALTLCVSAQQRTSFARVLYQVAVYLMAEAETRPTGQAQTELRTQALSLLVCVQQARLCWQLFKDRAGQLQPQLCALLPAEAAAEAETRGHTTPIEEMARSTLTFLYR